ncbi:AEC family transporter [Desulfovibrio sp. UCD-KL4C]|uniref:AEC family transporter n=1 Tax=Desulfovibrio sp. UCD-KL4C TaxID=2578120 RepID=UPI0025B83848|nr:AEC family transporter [Desulfovibrio sp. UCD-KL4C]
MVTLVLCTLIPIFLMILGGAFAYRSEILPENSATVLNGFVCYFTLPALIFGSLATTPINEIARGRFITGTVASMLISYLLMFIFSKYVFKSHYTESAMRAMTGSFPNCAFLGLPVMLSLFGHGKDVLIATTISILIPTLLIIIVVAKFSLYRADKDKSLFLIIYSIVILTLKTPLVISALIGIVFSILQISLPAFFTKALHSFGMSSIPCALFAVGIVLSKQKIKLEWSKILLVNFSKMILHPVLAAVFLSLLKVPENMLIMGVVSSGMPAAAITCVLSQEYETLEMETSASVLITTIIYMPCLLGTLFIAHMFGITF